jgi:hypothetical protein
MRHLLRSRGQAVALDGFRLIGERILDCSAEGVLLACDDGVTLGESVIISFPVPKSSLVFDAEAEVVRIIRGERDGDPGYCAGLRFVDFDRRDRLALGVDLRSFPQVPRRLRWGSTTRSEHGEDEEVIDLAWSPKPATRSVISRPILAIC